MDKQYKLTDRVSKDSIKSPIFKKWVKRILCLSCILSLALQLTLCCIPMQVFAADDSIIGTWVFNDTLDDFVFAVDMQFKVGNQHYIRMYTPNRSSGGVTYRVLDYVISIDGNNNSGVSPYDFRTDSWGSSYSSYKTIEILSDPVAVPGWSATVSQFISWLKANATKVGGNISYDFTGETRIFNDELTLFNTSEATFTNSFNFDFEVLGVGTADYLILQRTAENKYTMSYSFDFEDSGGLTIIYRDSPPFYNGAAEWLGGKVNRKVITFISNPEDPEFQQWLLDNTTLFDNVNDAYQLGQQSGYNNGYEEGFANSLIGDSLSGPINALSQITLIEIQGTAITLGGVVMTSIALCLVLAFLKLYAGG